MTLIPKGWSRQKAESRVSVDSYSWLKNGRTLVLETCKTLRWSPTNEKTNPTETAKLLWNIDVDHGIFSGMQIAWWNSVVEALLIPGGDLSQYVNQWFVSIV